MSDKILMPRDAAKFISENAENVKINQKALKELCLNLFERYSNNEPIVSYWTDAELNPLSTESNALDWIFFVDTLNFSFWSNPGDNMKYSVSWNETEYTGYWSLCAAVKRAIHEGIDILNPHYYTQLKIDDLRHLLRSDNDVPIPLLKERLSNLHEVGVILLEKFDGKFENVVKSAEESAESLLKSIVDHFPCYRDESTYKGKRVAIYKRAQILVGDIWNCFGGSGLGKFKNIEYLTAFADYRIPQTLAYFNILEYSSDLLEKLREMLESGSKLEVEIRGSTLQAIEDMCRILKDLIRENNLPQYDVNPTLLDNHLWEYRRAYAANIDSIPMHKTRCIFY